MCLDKEAVTSGGHCGARQYWGQFAVTAGCFSRASRALDRMSGIENDLTVQALHPINGSHVSDKVIIAEGGPPFGEKEGFTAGGVQFFGNICHVPGRQKLTFFDIDHPAGRGGSNDEVGLPAEKSGDLEHIDEFAGDLCFLGGVDIGRHGNSQFPADLSQQGTAIAHPGAPEGFNGSPVGFVVRGLENKSRTFPVTNRLELFRHPTGKCRRFHDTGSQNEQQVPATELHRANFHNRSSRHPLTIGGTLHFASFRRWMPGLARLRKNGSIRRMRFIFLVLLAATVTLPAQEAEQRKRMIFSTINPPAHPSATPSTTPTAPAEPGKHPEPAAAINAFFLALKAGQVDAAYDGLVKNTIIAERTENVNELKESTKKAIDHYGPVSGFEVVDTLQVGASLMRQTCISLNQDLPLRWRFYFYRSEGVWKIVDMRVDDGLVELFEETGRRQKP